MSENKWLILKRGVLFLFLLGFFLWPSQSDYLTIRARFLPAQARLLPLALPAAPYPTNFTGKPVPWFSAHSVLVVDPDSAVILYAKNEQAPLLPASTVKMMTALVVLEHYRLDDYLTVNGMDDFGQDIGLVTGERLSVANLLYGLLVASANDAAQVLAQHYPGGQLAFVARMNQKAQELNLKNTVFANPTGLDVDEQEHPLAEVSYSTGLDLSRLARIAWREATFRQLVATPQITITDASGMIKHPLTNINTLLGRLAGVQGIKTGWTERAGECLVSLVEREGHHLLVVVLGSQNRFDETARLVEWAFANYRWQDVQAS